MSGLTNLKIKQCTYCNSTNIRVGVPFNSMVTLKTDHFSSHQTFADLCNDCGSILRNYIETKKSKSYFVRL